MSRLAVYLERILSPGPVGLVIGILLVLTLPIFIHFFIHRSSSVATLPIILLAGPTDSGKTSLLTLFEHGHNVSTHTSQAPIAVECSLPVGKTAASSQFRSASDPSNQTHKKFLLLDTPGHGKLRYHALESISNPQNLKGIVFVVDAANLSAGEEEVREASEYLYDILLLLQKRNSNPKIPKAKKEVHLLVAANKMDLFTARPAKLVQDALQVEISLIRSSKSKGLLDSGVEVGGLADAEENDDWLGEVGSTTFNFKQMEEFDIWIEVLEGCAAGSDDSKVNGWWNWIGERL